MILPNVFLVRFFVLPRQGAVFLILILQAKRALAHPYLADYRS
jgi:hypothetical protein